MSVATLATLETVGLEPADVPGFYLALLGVVWFGYFVLLKGSPYRTLGYVVAGARIVNLKGERPGLGSLAFRLMFVIVGPMNALLDVLWLTGDVDRQALRDKFASTYVVRKDALPAGTGPVRFGTYTFWGMTFPFREVSRRGRAA
jgi:uncharacterized RDD family membrane protein YckC